MTNWDNLLEFYYDDMNRKLIGLLIENYGKILKEDNYQAFSLKSEEQLLSDIHQMNALGKGEDEGSFLYAFADFLRNKTEGIGSEGEWAYEKYLEQFEVIDQPYIKELIAYYKDKNYDFSRLQGEVELKNIASDLAGLTFPYTFWEGFVRSLKLRVEKLKEASPEEVIQQFREYFPYGERELVNQVLGPFYERDAYFSLYSLSKSDARKQAKELREYFFHSNAPAIFSDLLYKRLHQVQEENYAETEFMDALLKLYPAAIQEGVKVLVEALLKEHGVEKISHLSEYLSPESIHETIATLATNHPLFLGMASWFIDAAKAYTQKLLQDKSIEEVKPWQQVTAMLLEAESNIPVSDVFAEVWDETDKLITKTLTQAYGLFSFAFEQNLVFNGETTIVEKKKFNLKFFSQQNELLAQLNNVNVSPDEDKLTLHITLPEAGTTEPTLSLTELSNILDIEIPSVLAEIYGIHTLDDIRKAGGLESITKFQSEFPEVAKRLDAHATFETFSSDAKFNEAVITAGYSNFNEIAGVARHEFVEQLKEHSGDIQAAIFYQQAASVQAILKLDAAAVLSDRASGYVPDESSEVSIFASNLRTGSNYSNLVSRLVEKKCNCDDCETAVSPIAYLASLLDYTTQKLKEPKQIPNSEGGPTIVLEPLSVGRLEDLFHQPFCELLSACDEMDKRVCQTRIAVDVVRHYLNAQSSQNPVSDAEAKAYKSYLKEVYDSLLNSLGITNEQLRNADDAALEKLASRTGLEAEFIKSRLILNEETLTEANLEILFGFQSTLRNPLCTGFMSKTDGSLVESNLIRWHFSGYEWLKNTDEQGYIYIVVNPATKKISIFRRDELNTTSDLVGSAVLNNDLDYAEIFPENDSGLYGNLVFQDLSGPIIEDIKISLIPEVTANKLKLVRNRWRKEDGLQDNNAFFAPQASNTFIIDPDLISPDDMRIWQGAGSPYISNIWQIRALLLSEQYRTIDEKRYSVDANNKNNNVQQMLEVMKNLSFSYSITISGTPLSPSVSIKPWPVSASTVILTYLKELDQKFNSINAAERNEAEDTILKDLKLSLESFNRLISLIKVYEANLLDSQKDELTEEELTEIVNILIQAVKESCLDSWQKEERDLKIKLDSSQFYLPINDPVEGNWNLQPNAELFGITETDTPFIDPELHDLKSLPDPGYGDNAIALWQARKEQLVEKKQQILAAKTTGIVTRLSDRLIFEAYKIKSVDSTTVLPIATPTSDGLYKAFFEEKQNAVADTAHADHLTAIKFVNETLCLTVEEFAKIIDLRAKEATIASTPIAETEWLELANVLTSAWKRRIAYKESGNGFVNWKQAEIASQVGISNYWQAYKQKLVKWRATAQRRNEWTQALLTLSAAPLIDPDQLSAGDFVNPEFNGANSPLNNRAYELFRQRYHLLNDNVAGTWRHQVEDTANTFTALVNDIIFSGTRTRDAGTDELVALLELHENGINVSRRLQQLTLTVDALAYLVKYKSIASPLPEEKEQINNILLQVKKERSYGVWRNEEVSASAPDKQVLLSSEFFKVAYEQAYDMSLYLGQIFKPWRSSRSLRKAWQDVLESRIEQQAGIAGALAKAVEDTEGKAMPVLRDILLGHRVTTPSVNARESLEAKAKWLGDLLGIDLTMNCCQKTTRIAQAIETIQNIYFSLRNNILERGDAQLEIVDENYEVHWKWLGSYETWRSLMFVHLYPENVLMPSLRPLQSPKFREMVGQMRDKIKMDIHDACSYMRGYEEYLKDILSIKLQAAASAPTNFKTDIGCGISYTDAKTTFYNFALADSRKVYYNSGEDTIGPDFRQSLWKEVPLFGNTDRVIGAAPVTIDTGENYLYVFAVLTETNLSRRKYLAAQRLNLAKNSWETELIKFDAIKGEIDFDSIILSQCEGTVGGLSFGLPVICGIKDKAAATYQAYKLNGGKYELDKDKEPQNLNDALRAGVTIPLFDYKLFVAPLNSSGNGIDEGKKSEKILKWISKPKLISAWHVFGERLAVIFNNKECYFSNNTINERLEVNYLVFDLKKPQDNLSVFTSEFPFASNAFTYISLQDFFANIFPALISIGYNYTHGARLARIMSTPWNKDLSMFVGLVVDNKETDTRTTSNRITWQNKQLVEHISFKAFTVYWNEPIGSNDIRTRKIKLFFENSAFYINNNPAQGLHIANYSLWAQDPVTDAQTSFPYKNKLSYIGSVQPKNQFLDWLSYQTLRTQASDANIYIGHAVKVIPNIWTYPQVSIPLLPLIDSLPPIKTKINGVDQQMRKRDQLLLFQSNPGYFIADRKQQQDLTLTYLEEGYFFLPLQIAQELQKNKFYQEALDYFRLIYDYTLPATERKIYYGLIKEESTVNVYNAVSWLNEPDNPHTVAANRKNSYTRNVIINIVRCLLAYADQEFTRDTAESVPRARELYETALELIRYELIIYETQTGDEILRQVDVLVDDAGWQVEWALLKERINQINNRDTILEILNGFTGHEGIISNFSQTNLSWEDRFKLAEAAVETKWRSMPTQQLSLCEVVSQGSVSNPIIAAGQLGDPVMRTAASKVAEEVALSMENVIYRIGGEEALLNGSVGWLSEPLKREINVHTPASELTTDGTEILIEQDPLMTLQLSRVLNTPYVPFVNRFFCVPRNPVPQSLLLHAEANLFKIRNCRNIAGMKRELDPYAAPTDATTGMPMIGANGQISLSGRLVVAPTQYRYNYLIERVKNLVTMAQQVEAALLSALEKRDAEYYTLLKARQDIAINKAGVKLQDLRVNEAQDNVELAKLQLQKSEIMEDTYNSWLSAGLNTFEVAMLAAYGVIAAESLIAADKSTRAQQLQMKSAAYSGLANASSAAANAFNVKDPFSMALSITAATAAVTAAGINLAMMPSVLDSLNDANEANKQVMRAQRDAQNATFYASHERRKQEWELQRAMAQQDIKIGNQQVKLSDDRLRIVGQEKVISELQLDHAEATVNFLNNKFTNVDLYDWMSGILENAYSYFLQQATAMAQTAQLQLAFERQQSPAGLIQNDYWTPPAENLSFGGDDKKPADRKGITGSVRLLQDVTKLDQYAFDTNKRKLQLTKTISLAQQFPAEFALFRQTGILQFRTPMSWFDRDFPGHYLRIIRKVKTSVIALVPPVDGIKAKLSTPGVSRVVVQGDYFQTLTIPRTPESVSLTSPMNATGLFELEQQPNEFLFPFEGMGVDALWEFSMAKASNQMDYNTLADVLITLEYTALESADYNLQVVQGLDTDIRAERSFSLKDQFVDQWYDLHHPEQFDLAEQFKVTLKLDRQDFPINVYDPKIKNVSVFVGVSSQDPKDRDNLMVTLEKKTAAPSGALAGGTATSNDFGLISTKTSNAGNSNYSLYTGNASTWSSLLGQSPTGEFILTLGEPGKASDKLRRLLRESKVADIHLIVEFEGEGPTFNQ